MAGEDMSGFEADTTALRASADTVARIGEQASNVDLAAGVVAAAVALPGSRSASAATRLADTLTERLQTLVVQLEAYRDDLLRAADRYEASDRTAGLTLGAQPVDRVPWC